MLYGRSRSPLVSAVLPTRIQASRRRATSANGSVCGPGIGRAEARIAVVRAAELEVLGKRHQPGAAGGRLVGEGYRGGDVGRDVIGRIELDEGDREVHRAMVRRVLRGQRIPVS